MLELTRALLVAVLACKSIRCMTTDDRERFIIYSTGKWELRVQSVIQFLQPIITNFSIQTENTSGGIAVDYKGDQIFFAEGRNIYRIFLVDDNGLRKISKKGTLFREPNTNHFEVRLYNARKDIAGIFYDKNTSILYATADTDIIELNATSGKVINSQYVGYHRNVRNPYRYDGVTYVFLHFYEYYGYTWGIYKYKDGYFSPIVYGQGEHISGFTIDQSRGKLFMYMRSTIRMIDLKNATNKIHIDTPTHPHIVLGDSKYTNGLESIAAYKDNVVWSSSRLQKLYFGKMNEDRNFIPVNKIQALDHGVSSKHLCIFVKEDEKDEDDTAS